MKRIFTVLIAASIAGGAFAAGGDASEGGIPTSPLKIYSGGFGGGAMYSLNKEFSASMGGDVLGKLTIMNSWEFVPDVALFGDASWYIKGEGLLNFGLDLGCDYYLSQSRVKPFVGVGVGAHYFDLVDLEGVGGFGSKFGVSLTGHAGFALEMTETVHVRVRVPYHFVIAGDKQYHGVGVDVGVMFLSNLRKVQQLHY